MSSNSELYLLNFYLINNCNEKLSFFDFKWTVKEK